MRRVLGCVFVVWACSCGVRGPLPAWLQIWVANNGQANAARLPSRTVKLIGYPAVVVRSFNGVSFLCDVWGDPAGRFLETCSRIPRSHLRKRQVGPAA